MKSKALIIYETFPEKTDLYLAYVTDEELARLVALHGTMSNTVGANEDEHHWLYDLLKDKSELLSTTGEAPSIDGPVAVILTGCVL